MKNFPRKDLFHRAQNFRKGTLLCFTKYLVAKKFMDKRGGGRREYQNFSSIGFCFTVPKNSVRVPFVVSLDSGNEFFCASEGYVTIICGFFVPQSTVPKNLAAKPFFA